MVQSQVFRYSTTREKCFLGISSLLNMHQFYKVFWKCLMSLHAPWKGTKSQLSGFNLLHINTSYPISPQLADMTPSLMSSSRATCSMNCIMWGTCDWTRLTSADDRKWHNLRSKLTSYFPNPKNCFMHHNWYTTHDIHTLFRHPTLILSLLRLKTGPKPNVLKTFIHSHTSQVGSKEHKI